MEELERKNKTIEFVQVLKKEYQEGASINDLDRKYHKDIDYYFRKYSIPKRTKDEYKKWVLDNRPRGFKLNWMCDSIKNETEAYIIGFFMSDGYSTGSQFGLRLKEEDYYMLEKIKNYFSEKITIGTHKTGAKNFVISSYKVLENLEKLGISKDKTHKELSIPPMNKDLIRHFIRGYFDGDGSVFVCNKNKTNSYLKCNICSPTINILKEINSILKENGIDAKIDVERRIGKKAKVPSGEVICSMDMFRLFIRKKSEIKKFYNFLYDESTIYLDRKKEIFDNNKEMLEYKKLYANAELTNSLNEN